MTSSPPNAEDAVRANPFGQGPGDTSRDLLDSAWQRHRVYSKNATRAQDRFLAVERLITLLAVVVVVLAVAQPVVLSRAVAVEGNSNFRNQLPLSLIFGDNPHVLLGLLNLLLIIVPITMTALRAFAIKFSRGNNWVLLRGSAEALKMEIFYFRTQVQHYRTNRNAELAERLQQISKRLKGSVVQQRALSPYENQIDPEVRLGLLLRWGQSLWIWADRLIDSTWRFFLGFEEKPQVLPAGSDDRHSNLNAEGYIKYRLDEQFDWYRRKARIYDRQHQLMQTGVYTFGGLGTLLAAIGGQGWVAVTAALGASLINYMEYRRIEVTLMGYNQAADTLYDIRTWWLSLTEVERAEFRNFEKLVVNTEETIRSEHNSWLQDMQDRLANLYESEKKGKASESGAKKATDPSEKPSSDNCPADHSQAPEADISEIVSASHHSICQSP